LPILGAEVGVGLQPAGAALLVLAQLPFPVMSAVGLLGGHRQRTRQLGRLVVAAPQPAKHARGLAATGRLMGGQGFLGVLAVGGHPGQLMGAVSGGLVELLAEPVPLGPQLRHGQPLEVGAAGRVDSQRLAAGPGQGLGQLQVAIGLLPIGEVQLAGPLGLRPDHRIQPGLLPGPGQLHIQPVDVLDPGEADQRPPPGQSLGPVASRRVGQVHPSVALAAAAAIQIRPGQGHLPAVGAVEADGQGSFLGIKGRDGAAAAVGHAQLGDGVVAAHDPVPHRELAVLDLQPLGAEAAAGGQQLLAGAVEPVDLGPAGGQHDDLLAGVALGVLVDGPPVLQQGQGGGRLGVGGHHPVMGLVGGHGLLDEPGADQVEGFTFPGLVLAAVLGELAGAETQAEGTEAAAGVDRGQLPVIADQDHLGPGLLGVLQEPGELARADHAGLIDHQDRPGIQLLAAAIQVAQEPVAGGHLLESLALEADGRDAGRGCGQEPVAVQLPGMPGDAEGEGLARPRPPDHQGDALAALAQVTDHGLLIDSCGRVRGQGLAHRLMGSHGGLLGRPAGGGLDQLLLDRQEVGGGPAALLQGPVGDHTDRPLSQEPVRQLLELCPSGAGQASSEGDQDIGAGEGGRGRGQPVRAGQPIEQPTGHCVGHRPVLLAVDCPAGHLPNQGVRIYPALGRLRPPASIQGVRGLMLLGLAGSLHRPLDQPRRPLPTVPDQPIQLGVDLSSPLGEAADQCLGHPMELPVAVGVRWRPLHP
jgi:hypothetical protein